MRPKFFQYLYLEISAFPSIPLICADHLLADDENDRNLPLVIEVGYEAQSDPNTKKMACFYFSQLP